MENPFKMNDLGVTPFQERPKWWLIIDLDDGKIETGTPDIFHGKDNGFL